MGFTIVRIAGRPVTSASPKKMTIDPTHTELSLHNDPRLMAAVGAIVSHSAQRIGLPSEAQDGLAAAVMDACRETFPLLEDQDGNNSALKIIVEDFPDRVEVTLEHTGEALPTAGLDSFCGGGSDGAMPGISNSLQDTRVDRVQYETKNGLSRMKLIKYSGGRKAAV
jgi:hypothetical protein